MEYGDGLSSRIYGNDEKESGLSDRVMGNMRNGYEW